MTSYNRPTTVDTPHSQEELDELYQISASAEQFYRRVLEAEEAGSAGREYLEKRGVSLETAVSARMGFAPAGWDTLAKHLQKSGAALEKAEKLGLVRKRKEGGGYYDTFRNRLLFTISDLRGRAIGFGGRVLDDSVPKYINSPESPIYRKSEVLYGLDMAKKEMRATGSSVIVEGYFDHLALFTAGCTNVVATCGTALTEQHLKALRRYAESAVMLYDGDDAGRKGTVRSLDHFLDEGFAAKVAEVPPGDDPDSFVRREHQAGIKALLEKAKPIFEFYLCGLFSSIDTRTVEGKAAILNEVAPKLPKLGPAEKAVIEKRICQTLEVDQEVFQAKVEAAPATLYATLAAAEKQGITEKRAVLVRLRYLRENIQELSKMVASKQRWASKAYSKYKRNAAEVEVYMYGQALSSFQQEAKTLEDYINGVHRKVTASGAQKVSPEMIQRARNYNIADLVEKPQKGSNVFCPFHANSNSPAASIYHNTLYCHAGCRPKDPRRKGWDPILLLEERDGKSFPAAVRELQ